MATTPLPVVADADHPSGSVPAADILVIAAHPQMEHSRVNRRLMQRVAHLAGALSDGTTPSVLVRDLYALYPDYLIDVRNEQALLERAKLVVWQHPIHWYSMPALMKLWVDDVLTFGWAYGPGGTALRGKDLWLVTTTGGPEESYRPDSYNRYFFDAFLPPYEQTAALCGMRFLPPLVLHGAHRVADDEVAAHESVYLQRLASYPNWPEMAEIEAIACDVPIDARPAEEPDDDEPIARISVDSTTEAA
jgi:glutathione-regulated potassium-efflux system ancillary protein KefF